MIDVKFTGLPEALQKLRAVEGGVRDKALRVANNTASAILVRELRSRAPVGAEGALKRSMGRVNLKRGELPPGVDVGSKIGPVRKVYEKSAKGRINQFYKAWWIENTGAEPHSIKAGAKRLRIGNKYFGQVDHPGFSARPFIGQAQDAAFPLMDRAFVQAVDDFLTKIYGPG